MPWLTILRSRYTWIAAAVLLAVFVVYRFAIHEQEKGAARVQAVAAAKQAAQAKITMKGLSDRLVVAKAAQARSQAEVRGYQHAQKTDQAVIDYRTRCGGAVPDGVWDYITGDVPATGRTDRPDAATGQR